MAGEVGGGVSGRVVSGYEDVRVPILNTLIFLPVQRMVECCSMSSIDVHLV